MHLSDFIDVQSNLNNKVCIDDNNDSYRKFLPKRDYVLFNIAKNNQTYDIALEAIKNDGMELRFLSKKLLCDELIIEAVKNNAKAIEYVPENYKSNEVYNIVLNQNGKLLYYIEENKRTEKRCLIAVKNNGLALEFIPKKIISKELCEIAVKENGLALKYVPGNYKSKDLCKIALTNNILSFQYIPNKYKDKKLYEEIIKYDWATLKYIIEDYCEEELYIFWIEELILMFKKFNEIENDSIRNYIIRTVKAVHEKIKYSKNIFLVEKNFGLIKTTAKYDKKLNKFICMEQSIYTIYDNNFNLEHITFNIKKFNTLEKLYLYLDKSLKNVDFTDYDFKNTDIHKYNITDATIPTKILVDNGLYNGNWYDAYKNKYEKMSLIPYSEEKETKELIVHNIFENENSYKIGYISDIHIENKIFNKYKKYATKQDVINLINEIVDKMFAKLGIENEHYDFVFIGGDISASIEISKMFYESVKRYTRKIVAILGNHEIWDENPLIIKPKEYPEYLNKKISEYRDMCNELGIIFLQNELLIAHSKDIYPYMLNYEILDEEKINEYSVDQIQKICKDSRLTILGGLGFSGLNKKHNSTTGLYRNTISQLKQDIEETEKFRKIYEKINRSIPNKKVIVFTHTPKSNWTSETYNKHWIYVSGHTHRNEYYNDENKEVYADNQVGYNSMNIYLKYFYINYNYDIFKNYKDGIYFIKYEDYCDFNRGMSIAMEFKRTGEQIILLKKNNIYMFLIKSSTNSLYLLDGGRKNKLSNNDEKYYYDNMEIYTYIIKNSMKKYNEFIKQISNAIKSIGGDGRIHGSIVDIDFLNHIYINPIDGTITPYFAYNIVDKWIYKDVGLLLKEKNPDLYKNYVKLLNSNTDSLLLMADGKTKNNEIALSNYMPETFMYRASNTMKSLQYLTDTNIIRIWNDELINKYKKRELNTDTRLIEIK